MPSVCSNEKKCIIIGFHAKGIGGYPLWGVLPPLSGRPMLSLWFSGITDGDFRQQRCATRPPLASPGDSTMRYSKPGLGTHTNVLEIISSHKQKQSTHVCSDLRQQKPSTHWLDFCGMFRPQSDRVRVLNTYLSTITIDETALLCLNSDRVMPYEGGSSDSSGLRVSCCSGDEEL